MARQNKNNSCSQKNARGQSAILPTIAVDALLDISMIKTWLLGAACAIAHVLGAVQGSLQGFL